MEGVRLAIKAEGSHPHRKLRSAMEELSNGSLVLCVQVCSKVFGCSSARTGFPEFRYTEFHDPFLLNPPIAGHSCSPLLSIHYSLKKSYSYWFVNCCCFYM